jgi:hypothetical protein
MRLLYYCCTAAPHPLAPFTKLDGESSLALPTLTYAAPSHVRSVILRALRRAATRISSASRRAAATISSASRRATSPAFLRLRLGLAQDLLDAPAEAIERRCAVVPRRSPSHGRHATPTTQALTGNGVVGAPAQEGRDSFGTRRAEARAGDGTDHAYRAGPCCARRSLIPRARAQSRERLGAVRVRLLPADGDDESCLVMQDIEGNEFCLD